MKGITVIIIKKPFHMSTKNFTTDESLILKYAFKEELTAEESEQLKIWREKMKYYKNLPDQLADPIWVALQLKKRNQYPAGRVWEEIKRRVTFKS